ncbi:NADH:ubiquinone oxidoreductase subunit M [Rhodanobacter thiooxydans]|uniref:NADH-quinone oxidoreductase subunit M n=1 Tax=Rhodanobacter thiooxydans TaxID=416169 RepID=A0A154QIK9_9GAMM|nr:NADH-quinone oxidoreductase subunit M [Rhodanobacter thiooxydans]EIL99941.1 NADH:ubiquinone oxidoreductase subunit M [Rhodanobacter thiooxydans LCS2]KZC23534.1 NADH:ubiquinone oxidoreductase subunit M [Rhodanobacter thiooxydans]MCW0200576.1 NADH-quinone oxidoreductase subunit M [Rhodanobacter thiooxydans]
MFTHLLSLLIWLPIVGAVPVLLAGSARPMLARWLALLITIATFVISLWLLRYDPNGSVMQLQETHVWIATWGVHFTLAVDGISVALILMTTFVGILVIGGAWKVIQNRPHQYMACMLLLEGLLIGVFCATDALVFYAFFEAVLIPMYILIGMWGGPRRVYATLKLFIYTFTGSVFMLIALLYLYQKAHTFDLATLAALPLTFKEQAWLFFGFLIAFAIKVPMVPVHTWLPDAHVEAPTGGSVWLAAVMLKIGTYGMVRFILPITPDAGAHFAWIVIVLSLVAIIYIGYVALVQEDMKKLVAYSSVAHMGFVTLGIFMAFMLVREGGNTEMASLGMQGAMVQMISHGFVSGAMFTCIGVMYDRTHTRQIKDYGGVINMMPWFGFFYVLFAMANCGLPGTSGFVGEFMVILASFSASPWIALFATFTLIIGAGYTLWLVKRVLWGPVTTEHVRHMTPMTARETWVLIGFAVAVLAIGMWPQPLVHLMDSSVAHLVQQLAVHKI